MGTETQETHGPSTTEASGMRNGNGSPSGGPIAVGGMHRAGTSMVAKALRLAGLHLGSDGDLVDPAPDNPGGFFEHARVVRLDDDLLQATGGAWDHLPAIPPLAADDERVAELREPALELIEELAVAPSWGWKDPRTSLTVRFWLDLLPDLRVVVCVRNPLEVALSLKQRNKTSYAHAVSLWHGYYRALLDAVPVERRILTHFDAHARDPEAESARLLAFAGLPVSGVPDAIKAHDPDLRHHRLEISLAEAGLDPQTIELYRRLCEEAGEPVPEAAERGRTPARIDRNALDLHLATRNLERRARQVAVLERKRDALADRVDELEAAGRAKVLARLEGRLDRLEDATHELRYATEDLSGRSDADALRRCRQLVRDEVPRSAEVMVVAKGDPLWLDLHGRPAANFPRDSSGRYPGFVFDHSSAAIAHLEARRARDGQFLLIPEHARWWTQQFPGFATHLATRYRVLADESGAGLLVDVRARTGHEGGSPCSVFELIDQIAVTNGRDLAVLDLTGDDLAAVLPGHQLFSPPPGDALPYLDDTIDLVLMRNPGEGTAGAAATQLAEARRVATRAVAFVEAGEGGRIEHVDWLSHEGEVEAPPRVVFVPATPEPDPAWTSRLEETLAGEAAAELAPMPSRWSDVAEGGDVVAVLEEGVLPLPGCCAAARSTFSRVDGAGAAAVKMLAADGAIESAGVTVFADGSWAGTAAGSHQVVAPWHEYVRETCGGTGMLLLSAEAIELLDAAGSRPSVGSITTWTASLWDAGQRVLYQPDAVAVRAVGAVDESAAGAARISEAWAPTLETRPARPAALDTAAWRALVAREDAFGVWR